MPAAAVGREQTIGEALAEAGRHRGYARIGIEFVVLCRDPRPGDRVVIEFTGSASGDIRFACSVRGSKVLEGQLRCNVAA